MKIWAAVLAAGKSERFGRDKLWVTLDGKPVWRRSFEAFLHHPEVERVGVVASADRIDAFRALCPEAAFVAAGGTDRQESSRRAAEAAAGCDALLLHDAARPFPSAALISRVIEALREHPAVYPAIDVVDTIRQSNPFGSELLDRSKLKAVQTPQGVWRSELLRAHEITTERYTDDMGLLEAIDIQPYAVAGERRNMKITHFDDLTLLAATEVRTGIGYDIHPFSKDPARPLWLGGVCFEGPGLAGHSDADAALHALVDALLGAAGLGDIGQAYPDTEVRWKDFPSLRFLQETALRLAREGWIVGNVDLSIVAERPKIGPRRAEMVEAIAGALGIAPDRVAIKATTNEGLGTLGRGEGIAAVAVATLKRYTESR